MFSLNTSVDSGIEEQFRDFLSIYKRGYGTDSEYQYRLGVFAANLDTIAELNAANPTATFGVNLFADRTPEEMKQRMGFIHPAGQKLTEEQIVPTTRKHIAPATSSNISNNIPNSVDWSSMWNGVKDQGQCGSSWAFSATAAFEAAYAIKQGKSHVETLRSEQELIDCDSQSFGCEGGSMENAFKYLQSHRFCTEKQYPYHAKVQTCQESQCIAQPRVKAFVHVKPDDQEIASALISIGPLSIAVDASSFQFYSGGILSCSYKQINHGVVLVGYGEENDVQFWKIRNSWGNGWGEGGYLRFVKGRGG